jgi:hypothetical protein
MLLALAGQSIDSVMAALVNFRTKPKLIKPLLTFSCKASPLVAQLNPPNKHFFFNHQISIFVSSLQLWQPLDRPY